MLLSFLILLIGYKYVTSLYKFSHSGDIDGEDTFSIMTYNVRLFNLYDWIHQDNIEKAIDDLIKKENPDVLCLQEYHPHANVALTQYPYKYEKLEGKKTKYGQAIFCKFPIVNSGSINFPNTANNAIFVDVVKSSDTVRIYNIHLQSLGIDTAVESLNKEDSERLFKRISSTFSLQQDQTELFLKHKTESPYKTVVCGDFNNTAYSYVYRKIKDDLNDTFEAAGSGFGKTYDFRLFPTRIDFILADRSFKVNDFKTFNEKFSDHYPILSKLSLE